MFCIILEFIKIGNIAILTNDSDLICLVRKIYPYCSYTEKTDEYDCAVSVRKYGVFYHAKYKNRVYENLSVNGVCYFLYEAIQAIVEEIMIRDALNVLHGSVVEKGGDAFIFSAKTNGGKSTLVCALNYLGYRFISDDYAVLDDICSIIPVHLPIKLRTLIPAPELTRENVIVRDYNPMQDENYYLVRPFSYSENRCYRLRALFLLNRNGEINSISKLDYKDSCKSVIVNSKESDMKTVKRIAALSLRLIKYIDVYQLNYTDTFQCWNMIESLYG